MAKCWRCGTEESETWRFCGSKKEFVCMMCERACENYSHKLLPNGCNCRLTYLQPASRLFMNLTNSKDVTEAKPKYEALTVEQLRERYKSLHKTHAECSDTLTRAKLRVELAAICETAEEKKRGA